MSSSKSNQETKKKELALWGRGIAIEYVTLTESEAKAIIDNGISEQRFDALLAGSTRESGATDVSLYFSGEAVARFDIIEHSSKSEKPFELGEKGKFYLVAEERLKGDWGKLCINGAFDRSKLKVEVDSGELNGYELRHFDFWYDGTPFEFERIMSKGGNCFLLKPDGERLEIEFDDELARRVVC